MNDTNNTTRDELIAKIKRDVPCADYLEKSKGDLYCCPECGSGHKENHTGGVQVNQDDNTAHCHSCGAHMDSIALIQLRLHCDFNAALVHGAERLGIHWEPRAKGPVKAAREHLYPALQGEAGRIKKVMYAKDAPKRACWYHQEADGSWVPGRKGYMHRLYVSGGDLADARVVVVTEGEKDADSVAAFGCVAVSGENGANYWHPEYNLQLAGKDIVLLGDNDDPGGKYLDKAQAGLLGVAKTLKRLDLRTIWPDIPVGGDVSDYIAHVGVEEAKDKLRSLITMTQPIDKEETRASTPLTREQEEFVRFIRPLSEYEEEDIEWLVPDYLPRGGIVILAGDGGTGKTSVIADLAAAVSQHQQTSVLGPVHSKRSRRVLLLNAEDPVRKVLKKRLRLAGVDENQVLCPDWKQLGDVDINEYRLGSEKLLRMIEFFRPELVVIDPFQSFLPSSVNMAARNQIRQCLQPLVALGERIGCTFVVVCHTNKQAMASGRMRIADSADIWDIARSVLMVGEADDDETRYISNEKNSYAPLQDTVLFQIGESTIRRCGTSELRDREYQARHCMAHGTKSKQENARDAILTLLGEGELESNALVDKLIEMGCSKASIRRAREALSKDGKIVRRTVGNGKGEQRRTYWQLPSQGDAAQEEDVPPLFAGAGLAPPPEDQDALSAGFFEVLENDEPLPFPAEGDDPFAVSPPPMEEDDPFAFALLPTEADDADAPPPPVDDDDCVEVPPMDPVVDWEFLLSWEMDQAT